MINESEHGGLKMIYLCSFSESLETTWVKKCLDTTDNGEWKPLFDLELENYVHCNINVFNTNKGVRVTDPFLKEILEKWAKTNLVDQEQVSWFNSVIRIDNKLKPIISKSGWKQVPSKLITFNQGSTIFWLWFWFQTWLKNPLGFYDVLSAVKSALCEKITDTAERDYYSVTLSEKKN